MVALYFSRASRPTSVLIGSSGAAGGAGAWACSRMEQSAIALAVARIKSFLRVGDALERVVIPRISIPAVFRASIVEPDLLSDLRHAHHVGAALGTTVQLLPL